MPTLPATAVTFVLALIALFSATMTIRRVTPHDPGAWKKGRVFGLAVLAGGLAALSFLHSHIGFNSALGQFDIGILIATAVVGGITTLAYPLIGISAIRAAERLQKIAVPSNGADWTKETLLTLLPFWPVVLAYWVVMTPLLAIVERIGGDG